MKVQEIATRVGISAHTVRYYHRMGLLSATRDADNRHRRFDVQALERLRFVRKAKRLGFSLAEIRQVLDLCHTGESPCPAVRDVVRERIAENAAHIAELECLQRRLVRAQRQWAELPDRIPDGNAVCHLIESFAADEAAS